MATETLIRKRTFNFCFLDLNAASEEELSSVPLVGPNRARALVEHRPFETMEDVKSVPGISDEQLQALVDAGAIIGPCTMGLNASHSPLPS